MRDYIIQSLYWMRNVFYFYGTPWQFNCIFGPGFTGGMFRSHPIVGYDITVGEDANC